MKLLVIILAFGLYHYMEKPVALRSFEWLTQLRLKLSEWIKEVNGSFTLALVLPVFLLYLLLTLVFRFAEDSIWNLLLHIFMVYYCLGPGTIESMIKNNQTSDELNLSKQAKAEEVVNKLTNAALHRWFGVFFWYLALGVYGAFAYRILWYFTCKDTDANVRLAAGRMVKVIEFPVIVLMTLSLALASDFDRVWRHCKQYLNIETIRTLNSQFMYKSMDFAVEQCEIDDDDASQVQSVELTTFTVLKRMLVVWLVFSALLVIFSIG